MCVVPHVLLALATRGLVRSIVLETTATCNFQTIFGLDTLSQIDGAVVLHQRIV